MPGAVFAGLRVADSFADLRRDFALFRLFDGVVDELLDLLEQRLRALFPVGGDEFGEHGFGERGDLGFGQRIEDRLRVLDGQLAVARQNVDQPLDVERYFLRHKKSSVFGFSALIFQLVLNNNPKTGIFQQSGAINL